MPDSENYSICHQQAAGNRESAEDGDLLRDVSALISAAGEAPHLSLERLRLMLGACERANLPLISKRLVWAETVGRERSVKPPANSVANPPSPPWFSSGP